MRRIVGGIVVYQTEHMAVFVAEDTDTVALLEHALQLVGTGITAEFLAAELIIEPQVAIDVQRAAIWCRMDRRRAGRDRRRT